MQLLELVKGRGGFDASKNEVVVRFHRGSFGLFGRARRPWLEIAPDAAGILDEVLTTFIWVELHRRNKDLGLRGLAHIETGGY